MRLLTHCRFLSTNNIKRKVRSTHNYQQRPSHLSIGHVEINDNRNDDNWRSLHQKLLADAIRPSFEEKKPVLLHDHEMKKCDAVYCWNNFEYLRLAVGDDTLCHVEMGGPYNSTEKDTGQNSNTVDITFGEYIHYMELHQKLNQQNDSNEIEKETGPLLYLAQNDLFPALYHDFTIPQFCQDSSYEVGHGSLYSTMIWFGPKGVISPLHYDPLDNILMQFVGRKKVLLFPPMTEDEVKKNGDHYYSGAKYQQQYNTSAIPSHIFEDNTVSEGYHDFMNAPPAIECILHPGDILYIPSKWWHYVRSLDVSVSVNNWWR